MAIQTHIHTGNAGFTKATSMRLRGNACALLTDGVWVEGNRTSLAERWKG